MRIRARDASCLSFGQSGAHRIGSGPGILFGRRAALRYRTKGLVPLLALLHLTSPRVLSLRNSAARHPFRLSRHAAEPQFHVRCAGSFYSATRQQRCRQGHHCPITATARAETGQLGGLGTARTSRCVLIAVHNTSRTNVGFAEGLGKLDTSLKRHTALLTRLRSSLASKEAVPGILKDIAGLSLEKYVEEAVGATVEGVARCKTGPETQGAVDVCPSVNFTRLKLTAVFDTDYFRSASTLP